uniref:Uncharacterized protein n=1 Tax=Drosophila rhopaloa TaxID=1041015 RepID=A0A6P4E0C0_DRORH
IHSQQRYLNEITDTHINLRHLVADLQSSSDEKLMVAKVQRDLHGVKAECYRLETEREREQLQQKVDSLQSQLVASESSLQQAHQDFHQERTNSEIKHKFLQHSLLMITDKDAKFTPLVFLNNFVFAYQKFQRRLDEEQMQQRLGDHTALIDEVTAVVQAKIASKEESSQQLVKLIRSETQSRHLEQRCEVLQTKEDELGELRLRQATDTEHWSTIQALFGDGVTQTQSKVDAETSTNAVTPIPDMRRAAQLIDRQSSPFVKLSETVVQTNGILSQHNQSVQTADVQVEDKETRRDSQVELQKMQETRHTKELRSLASSWRRSANEVQLWEKQKRYQQQAEKTMARLEETELALDKTRALLQAARTTIARLEKDKQILESKLGRNGPVSSGSTNNLQCCRTSSCPNLQLVGVNKFMPSPSESPET